MPESNTLLESIIGLIATEVAKRINSDNTKIQELESKIEDLENKIDEISTDDLEYRIDRVESDMGDKVDNNDIEDNVRDIVREVVTGMNITSTITID